MCIKSADNRNMKSRLPLKYRYFRLRATWRKRRRLLFPSPAEVELIRILGGSYITVTWFKDLRTGFPLTIITDLGTVLKRELIEREVRVGAMFIDFGVETAYYRRGLEVDGRFYHNVVQDQIRDEYLAQYGWQILHIPAADIYRTPAFVQRKVVKFLSG